MPNNRYSVRQEKERKIQLLANRTAVVAHGTAPSSRTHRHNILFEITGHVNMLLKNVVLTWPVFPIKIVSVDGDDKPGN